MKKIRQRLCLMIALTLMLSFTPNAAFAQGVVSETNETSNIEVQPTAAVQAATVVTAEPASIPAPTDMNGVDSRGFVDEQGTAGWTTAQAGAFNSQPQIVDNKLVFGLNTGTDLIDTTSPQIKDGEYGIRFTPDTPNLATDPYDKDTTHAVGRFDFVVRASASNYLTVEYQSLGNWLCQWKVGSSPWTGTLFKSDFLKVGKEYNLVIRYVGSDITLFLDGKNLGTQTLPSGAPTTAGQIGIHNHTYKPNTLEIRDIYNTDYATGKTYTRSFSTVPTVAFRGFNDPKNTYTTSPSNVSGAMSAVLKADTPVLNYDAPKYTQASLDFDYTPTVLNPLTVLLRNDGTTNAAITLTPDTSGNLSISTSGVSGGVTIPSTALTVSGGKFTVGTPTRMSVTLVNNTIWVLQDGKTIATGELPSGNKLPVTAGVYGFKSSVDLPIKIDNIVYKSYNQELEAPDVLVTPFAIASSDMEVTLDNTFPRVIGYKMIASGKTMNGQAKRIGIVTINNVDYIPSVVLSAHDATSATYILNVDSGDGINKFAITVKMSVEGKNLIMDTKEIKKLGSAELNTISYKSNALASTTNADTASEIAAYWPIDNNIDAQFNWNKQYDILLDLKTGMDNTAVAFPYPNPANQPGTITTAVPISNGDMKKAVAYGFLSNGNVSATMVNNRVNERHHVVYTITSFAGVTTGSLQDDVAYYHYTPLASTTGSTLTLDTSILNGPLPYTKVCLSEDVNSDSKVDWEDGAITYRNNMLLKPENNEYIKNSVAYIDMNFMSTAGNPFLRSLDTVKKIFNLTDGFGQLAMHKGYAAEGHDDSHPDYGSHFGVRLGGVTDFNSLTEASKQYNAKIGIHINAVGVAPDAFNFDKRTNNLTNGYAWVDNTYSMILERDTLSGQLKARLDELKRNAPGLAWVYLDVYSESDWVGNYIATQFENNDWMIATEMGGPIQSHVSMTHWGADIGYPGQTASNSQTGHVSLIKRFVMNSMADAFEPDPLLGGATMLTVGDWQQLHDYNNATKIFFGIDLPTKYLQNYTLTDYKKGVSATFTNGVRSVKEGANTVIYSKDNKKVAILPYNEVYDPNTAWTTNIKSKVFIPWDPATEDKIYAYDYAAGSTAQSTTTWDVPTSWGSLANADLYKLTDTGRVKIATVPITAGKVTLTLDGGTGYVLYKGTPTKAAAANWGEMTLIPDNGFDSHTFTNWTTSTTTAVTMTTDNRGEGDVVIGSNDGATVSQSLSGLNAGKAYTAAIWANIGDRNLIGTNNNANAQMRKASIVVKDSAGNVLATNYITRNITPQNQDSQPYSKYNFHPIKVDFKAPADGKIIFEVAAEKGTAPVTFDNATVIPFLEDPAYTLNDPKVPLYEDFESVDAYWGPFELSKHTGGQTHLVEKATATQLAAGLQAGMNYVIGGHWSLRTKEEDAGTGEMLRTLPQYLRLDPLKKYKLSFDYKSYSENTVTDMSTPYYSVAIKGTQGNGYVDFFNAPLANSAKTAYTGEAYLTEPAATHFEMVFETGYYGSASDPLVGDVYLAFNKLASGNKALTLDNIKIEEVDSSVPTTLPIPTAPTVVTGSAVLPVVAITASSSGGSTKPQDVIDGSVDTQWDATWTANQFPQSLTFDFGSAQTINTMNFWQRNNGVNGLVTAYNIYTSNDGTNWGTAIKTGTWTATQAAKNTVDFTTSLSTRYVKFEITAGNNGYASVGEIQFVGSVGNPTGVAPVTVTTFKGVLPTLPTTVTATMVGGTTAPSTVAWNPISANSVANYGSFTVTGKTSVGIDATATVNVVSAITTMSAVTLGQIDLTMNSSFSTTIDASNAGQFKVSYTADGGQTYTPLTTTFVSYSGTPKKLTLTMSDPPD